MASCSTDGTLRIWSVQQRKLLHILRTSTALTALATSPASLPPMVAVGDQMGVVRVYSVPNTVTQAPKLIWRQRYHTRAVTALSWDPQGRYLVTGGADGCVYFTAFHITGTVKTSLGGLGAPDDKSQGLFTLLGFTLLTTEILSLCWEADSSKLYALIQQGNVFRLTPPPVTAVPEPESLELAPQQVNLSVMKATVDLTTIATSSTYGPSGHLGQVGVTTLMCVRGRGNVRVCVWIVLSMCVCVDAQQAPTGCALFRAGYGQEAQAVPDA